MSLAEVVWYGKRSAYADQVRGCYLQGLEDVEVLSIKLSAAEGRATTAEARADALSLRPSWSTVVVVGGGGVAAGVVLTVAAIVIAR